MIVQQFIVWFLFAMLILVGVVDTWLMLYRGVEYSISATIWELSAAYPIIPLAVGILIGHLFWPQKVHN